MDYKFSCSLHGGQEQQEQQNKKHRMKNSKALANATKVTDANRKEVEQPQATDVAVKRASLFTVTENPLEGKKFRNVSLAPIIKWAELPVGTMLAGTLVGIEESPNDAISNSPVLRFNSVNEGAGEYLVPLGGGLMKPLGIKRGGGKGNNSTTIGNAEPVIRPLVGKIIVITLKGFMETTKISTKEPKQVALFDIQIEEDEN